jgi:hypothetical protein
VWRQLPKGPVAAYLLCIGAAISVFATRTWYYTGVWSLFAGTTRDHNGTGLSLTWASLTSPAAWRGAFESVMMIITVQDPPRFDIRAILVIAGVVAAAAGLLNVPIVRRVPFGLALGCVGAIVGGLVARGAAYPGRFSIHLIPIAVAVSICAVTQMAGRSFVERTRERPGQSRPAATESASRAAIGALP